jgi:hypothetical protein
MPAPARNTHLHSCGHFDACYAPAYDDCSKCRNKKANKRMLEDYESRLAENQSVGV